MSDNLYKSVSIADLDDLLMDNTSAVQDPKTGSMIKESRVAGTLIDRRAMQDFLTNILDQSSRLTGRGSVTNTFQNFNSRLDRLGGTYVPTNTLSTGYTFITRPRLNLTGANIHNNAIMTTLFTEEPRSVPFMMRMLLDTRLCRGESMFLGPDVPKDFRLTDEVVRVHQAALKSPLVDVNNPFFVPLCNGLKGISGFPDFTLETETNEGDFHSTDFTFAKGSDFNNRTTEFSLEFKDVQGSVILSIFYYWCLYIALQAKGVLIPYPDDEFMQRLNYTVSIYRFITDPARQNVLWWAKATGCFPKSVPVGALFNVNQDEVILSSAMNFSIPFTVNAVEVNNPAILLDFNILMRRYCPSIHTNNFKTIDPTNKNNNFDALPYISATENGVKLLWRSNSSYIDKNYSAAGLTTEDWNNISSEPEQNKELNEEMLKSLFEQDGSYLDSEE